ncbi:MAG: glycosyltransferase family 2 protein [Lachnospiraceae bacterium]|nr:glycosyltransferase family 2 protein [Lachnospiraceae bacterium]
MKNTLFVKYNRTRKTEYQIKTEIIEENGTKYVIKAPLNDTAINHIERIQQIYDNHRDYYNEVKLVPVTTIGKSVRCEFIKGSSIADYLGRFTDDIDTFVSETKKYLGIALSLKQEYKCDFCLTDEFIRFFGKIWNIEMLVGMPAMKLCNLDQIFDNFIITDEGLFAIDYEWMVDFPVPAEFVAYRMCQMLYISCKEALSKTIGLREFVIRCGINEDHICIYEEMDDLFRQVAFGFNFEDIYTERYKQPVLDLQTGILKQLELKENHINNLESNNVALHQELDNANGNLALFSNQLSVYRRAIHNPFYWCYCFAKKVGKKVLPTSVKKGLKVWKNEGYSVFKYKLKARKSDNANYEKWIKKIEDERHIELVNKSYPLRPLISVLVPVYNVKSQLLEECLDSVINQSYDNWELCVVDDCSTMEETVSTLKRYENRERIKIAYRSENGHISRTTNQALDMATGDYIALLDCDDLLSRDALLEVVNVINENNEAEFIYSDEDKVNEEGTMRFEPYFKPDWSPDTLMSLMYTCHLGVFKKSVIDGLGGLRIGYEGSQDYDLVLRMMEVVDYKNIVHIPQILYHWRTRTESTAADISAKPYILEATKKAKEDACKRRGINARIEYIKETAQFRVRYLPNSKSYVSIIIPSKDNPEILERCLGSIRHKTLYAKYEIIIVDNGSAKENKEKYENLATFYRCRYIYNPMEFNFSHMCNLGAEYSNGNYLLFLNDDMEVLGGEWLERMLGQAELPHIGAVGAKLLYPNSSNIQHIGVLNIAPGPSHALGRMDDNVIHYFGINKNDTNYLAVTAACLMVSKDKFQEVGGFDEDLRVAYNDVDFCFKLAEAGYYNVSRMDVVLYHYESFSRGIDTFNEEKMRRLIGEREKLYRRHPQFALKDGMDPYYNHRLIQNGLDYSYNYSNINTNKVETYDSCSVSSYSESETINSNNEVCVVTESSIYIRGWAFNKNKNRANASKVRVLFIGPDNQAVVYKTVKEYRPDVEQSSGRKKVSLTGYMLNTKTDTDLSDYRVAIAIGKKIKYIK